MAGGRDLADTDDPADAAARLEEALDRIAALAEQVAAQRGLTPALAVDPAAVAERLDMVIAKLRAALAGRPA
jgi:hypothetical protein